MVLRILVSKYKHPLSFLVRAYTYNDRPTFCPESLGNRLARQEGTSNPDTRPCTMIFDTNTSSQHPREPPRCIPDSNRIWFLRSATLLLEFPFLFVSYFRSLHCYPTPNFFCPFFSPIKKETANKTATDNFSTLRSPVLDDQRVLLRWISWKWIAQQGNNERIQGLLRSSIRRGRSTYNRIFRCRCSIRWRFKLLAYFLLRQVFFF